MEKYISEEVIWKFYEAEKMSNEVILKAVWQAQNTEYIDEMARLESLNLSQEPEIKNFGEAEVCIKIAKWRAGEYIRKQNYDDMLMDTYIQVRDMISMLKPGNKLLINPMAERRIIDHYNRPRRLREKFRSQTLDLLLNVEIARSEYEQETYKKFRKKLFPYLPPYSINI